jgi:magnesium chelatase subunit D
VSAAAFPFSAVVGNDDAKTALVLAAIDPAIGGVLLRGEKGSAKTTLARGLAALLPGTAPFVELPLGATEERVVGSLDLAAALTESTLRFQPGLLAAADGGVLYVDEVNLLADHLVDVLLDVVATGLNRVERDNLSHEHPARFVLVGSMNPEEGDLRPQLLDRFGLAVAVRAPENPEDRAEVVRRRFAFDTDRAGFAHQWSAPQAALARRLTATRPARLDDTLLTAACQICAAAGAEGMRADLVLARAAAAHAAWAGRADTTADDLRAVAPLMLAHRGRRHPLDPPGTPPDGLDDALDDTLGPADDAAVEEPPPDGRPARPVPTDGHGRVEHADPPTGVIALRAPKADQPSASGRRSTVTTNRGRTVGHRPPSAPASPVAVVPTLTVAAARRAADPGAAAGITAADLREPVRDARSGNLLVVAVDASGSMGADARMAAVKGALLGLLEDAYQRRDRVALVTFAGDGARVALRPTGSVEIARARLDALPTGGQTPLADGIRVAADLATHAATPTLRPLLVLVTDGRATAGSDPAGAALAAAASVARRRLPAVLVDVERPGPGALGLVAPLAEAMGARLLSLPELTAGALEAALRDLR